MPDLYFNPYSGASSNHIEGKAAFLATAKAIDVLRDSISRGVQVDTDGLSKFCVVRDASLGCSLKLTDLLSDMTGSERVVVQRFLSLFSMGKIINTDVLAQHENFQLKSLDLPAPILEYALANNGLATTVACEEDWRVDFIEFTGTASSLPNIWGQSDLSHILRWVDEQYQKHTDIISQLTTKYNATICNSALKCSDFAPDEWIIVFQKLDEARLRNFEHDGYLVKDVESTSLGPLKQIKHLGSGIRIYLVNIDSILIIGGFYKKGTASSKKRENDEF